MQVMPLAAFIAVTLGARLGEFGVHRRVARRRQDRQKKCIEEGDANHFQSASGVQVIVLITPVQVSAET